jgi:hypothetical protein
VTDDLCSQCGHLNDPHLMVATTGDPLDGGARLCPEEGCECFATWNVPQVNPERPVFSAGERAYLLAMKPYLTAGTESTRE